MRRSALAATSHPADRTSDRHAAKTFTAADRYRRGKKTKRSSAGGNGLSFNSACGCSYITWCLLSAPISGLSGRSCNDLSASGTEMSAGRKRKGVYRTDTWDNRGSQI